MLEREPANLGSYSRFPSGNWTGYFLQSHLPGRHSTNLVMTCFNGQLSGKGADWVGPYTIEGEYDVNTGKCDWIKRYLGKHSVAYQGVNDGSGIWGVWEISQLGGLYIDRGGFHIWPEGMDVSAESERIEEAVVEAMHNQHVARLPQVMMGFILTLLVFAIIFALIWRENF